ncbi:MAG: hypothetical protein IJ559_03100 [Prevotella sp.]|nr:hypothetical protein [Prevotella sp.]
MKKINSKVAVLMVLMNMTALTTTAQKVYYFKQWTIDAGQSAYTEYMSDEKVEGVDLLNTANEPVALYYISDLSASDVTLELDRHFAVSNNIPTNTFYFTNSSNCGGLYAYGSVSEDTYFSVVNLKKGDVVRVVYNGTILKYANTNYTYTWNSSWNMALKALYAYNEKNGSSGIADAEVKAKSADNVIYDLQGRRMQSNHLPRGLFIRNGKKNIVK